MPVGALDSSSKAGYWFFWERQIGMDSIQQARGRYQLNAEGRKEKDGFVCAGGTKPYFVCVAVKRENGVHIRDTKDPSDVTLSFTDEEWKVFIEGVKKGEFDV